MSKGVRKNLMAIFSGVFSDLRKFGNRKKLACYASLLVPIIQGSALADPNVREYFEREFGCWLKMAEQDFGWVVPSEDRQFKPDCQALLAEIPAFSKFSKAQQLVCYDTFLVPFLMAMARNDEEFRRDFVESFVNWEREMRKLYGWLGWKFY